MPSPHLVPALPWPRFGIASASPRPRLAHHASPRPRLQSHRSRFASHRPRLASTRFGLASTSPLPRLVSATPPHRIGLTSALPRPSLGLVSAQSLLASPSLVLTSASIRLGSTYASTGTPLRPVSHRQGLVSDTNRRRTAKSRIASVSLRPRLATPRPASPRIASALPRP